MILSIKKLVEKYQSMGLIPEDIEEEKKVKAAVILNNAEIFMVKHKSRSNKIFLRVLSVIVIDLPIDIRIGFNYLKKDIPAKYDVIYCAFKILNFIDANEEFINIYTKYYKTKLLRRYNKRLTYNSTHESKPLESNKKYRRKIEKITFY